MSWQWAFGSIRLSARVRFQNFRRSIAWYRCHVDASWVWLILDWQPHNCGCSETAPAGVPASSHSARWQRYTQEAIRYCSRNWVFGTVERGDDTQAAGSQRWPLSSTYVVGTNRHYGFAECRELYRVASSCHVMPLAARRSCALPLPSRAALTRSLRTLPRRPSALLQAAL